ncbi:MAG: alpha/beta hydrolase [Clostridiales bacterium]|nr:alpha/beta hydrolase [Clostridiales bacterium]
MKEDNEKQPKCGDKADTTEGSIKRSENQCVLSDCGNAEKPEETLSKSEIKKRNKSIRRTKFLFRAIDVLYKSAQNKSPYVDKSNIGLIEATNDIVYDENEPDICKFDFYRNKTEDKLPAIILIHGGGFSAGDKKYRKGRAQFFALHGFAVFAVNYGLAPQCVFPKPLEHVVNAANFIYKNSDKYNIDRNRILVGGDSAGGYYAAMLAAFNGNENMKNIFGFAPEFRFFGALLNCGVYDMNTVLKTKYPFNLADGVALSLMGVRCRDFDDYAYRNVCMPIELVTAEFPPTFIIYSDNDTFCKGQGDAMLEKLESEGVYTEHYCARHQRSNHCFSLTWSGEDAAAANELLLSFAKRLASDKIKLDRQSGAID